jgi:ketosteroid isomerase-like protein
MRAAVVVVACVVVAVPALALARQGPASSRVPTVTRLVQLFSGLESEWMDAVRRGDETAVSRVMGDSFEMRTALAPADPVPAAQWVQSAVHDFHLRSFRISDMAARDLGPVAVVSFRLAQQAVAGGKDESAEFFIVDVWVQQDGAWKVAARHADAPEHHRPLGSPAVTRAR